MAHKAHLCLFTYAFPTGFCPGSPSCFDLQGVRKRLYLFQKVLFLWALM